MFGKFKQAPLTRAILNIGCLLDIPTGHYVKGKNGESIMIGGLAPLTGVGARGNMFKSTILHYQMLWAAVITSDEWLVYFTLHGR